MLSNWLMFASSNRYFLSVRWLFPLKSFFFQMSKRFYLRILGVMLMFFSSCFTIPRFFFFFFDFQQILKSPFLKVNLIFLHR